ncbi:MAG: hypothetical protein L3J63_10175 [Geopsychrobacter sp.]|nr:hypothetical protein [Geopsychrobacter sp.]
MESLALLIIVGLLLAYTLFPLAKPAELLIIDEGPLVRRRKALEQEKKNNLKAIKDIDFELATGKISEEDHQELRTLFSLKVADALETEKQLREEDNVKS